MNKLFSYLYEMNWRFMRKEENDRLLPMMLLVLALYAIIGSSVYLLTTNLGMRPFWFLLSAIPSLFITLFLCSGFIQEKFKKFESEKVKFGKKLDEKYIEFAKICYSYGKDFQKIKDLANYVFPKLRELHSEKEVNEKVYTCFRSVVMKGNSDTIRYFIFEQNVRISDEYRKNLKIQYPEIEELFNLNYLNHELNDELKVNKSSQIPKRIKI